LDPIALYIGTLPVLLLASGVGSFFVRQSPGSDENLRRRITRGAGAMMILSGLFGTFLAILLASMPRW
jgi:hypothetical protein